MVTTLIPPFCYQAAIRAVIDAQDLTQTELGEAIGITQGRVSQILNGTDSDKIKYETRHRLYELCVKNGIEVEYD